MSGRSLARLWSLSLLACVSCLSGMQGRELYRRIPDRQPEPRELRERAPKGTTIVRATPSSPLSLTSSDGTALTLERMAVRGYVEGPLLLTELHFEFFNPEPRTIEGRFEISLPPNAELSRFAMRVGGSWQEAEVVERLRAQTTYETVLHQGLDPALLEHDAGNHFSARVFPIDARESKQLIVSYTQALADGEGEYVIPLRGLPKLPALDVEVRAAEGIVFERVFERLLPEQDLVVPLPRVGERAFVAEGLALARIVAVPDEQRGEPPARDQPFTALTILFDTSASRALDFTAKLERTAALCAALRSSGNPHVELIAFDQTRETIYSGPLSGLGSAHFDALARRRPLGATDLPEAIASLPAGGQRRLLLATDGVSTVGGDLDVAALAKQLSEKGFVRVDVLVDGSVREQAKLEGLVSDGNLRFAGQLLELDRLTPERAVSRLLRASLPPLRVEVAGAEWFSPQELRGLQAGDAALVYAEFARTPKSVKLTTQGQQTRVHTLPVTKLEAVPLLERALASRRARDLVAQLEQRAAREPEWALTTMNQIVELGTEYRLLTPYTAMLVLENERMFEQFGIERAHMAPVLFIGEDGLHARRSRDAWVSAAAPRERERERRREAASVLEQQRLRELEQLAAESEAAAVGETFHVMDKLEKQSQVLADRERRAEQERRERLLQLEREAAGWDGDANIDALLDPSRVPRQEPPAAAPEPSPRTLEPSPRAHVTEQENPLQDPHAFELDDAAESASVVDRKRGHARRDRQPAEAPARIELRRSSNSAGFEPSADDLADIDAAVASCYDESLHEGRWGERIELMISVRADASIEALHIDGAAGHPRFDACLRKAAPSWTMHPSSAGREGALLRRYMLVSGYPSSPPPPERARRSYEWHWRSVSKAAAGHYAELLNLLEANELERAHELADIWLELEPGNPLALLAFGKLALARGDTDTAARAYAGLLDLHPSRPDIRRFAGNLLESLPQPELALAIDSYERAIVLRPDQPSSYRMLAMAQARSGELEQACLTLERALELHLPARRYEGVLTLLTSDLSMLAAARLAREPDSRRAILRRTMAMAVPIDEHPTLRFALSWETDASDVDLHVRDGEGDEAYYGEPSLRSGGALFADVRTGYGPEGFLIEEPAAFPYAIGVDYYSRGNMGDGMGVVQIVAHDGRGNLRFDTRPFVVMREHVVIDLGSIDAR